MTKLIAKQKSKPVPREIPRLGFVPIDDQIYNNALAGLKTLLGSIDDGEVIEKFKLNYLISELVSKYPIGESALSADERKEVGYKKLLAANTRCKEVNDFGYFHGVIDPSTLSSILQVAANKCRIILGDFSYNVYKLSKFTNGSTTCRTFKQRDPYFKYRSNGSPIDVSGRALSRLRSLIELTPVWAENGGCSNISIRNSDNITYVPKNATEDRAIVPQQAGNVLMQSAFGQYIRKRLKLVGIDLTDQSINQEHARTSSISNWGATLDLKNASALMNYRIVWDLLPPDWFAELDVLRNTHGTLWDGSLMKWEMFSSMGNGYNFELESLLFYAIALSATEYLGDFVGSVSVYGDDIIVPSSTAQFVCDVLTSVGFEINEKKSHFKGPFRESCGAHYYSGVDVKPFYIRKEIKTLPDVIRLGNRLRTWASVQGTSSADPRYYNLWKSITGCIPWYLRGGRDNEDIGALITHENPRYRIQSRTKLTPIHGWRAYCRQLQSSNAALVWDHRINMMTPGDNSQPTDASAVPALVDIDESVYLVRENWMHPRGELSLFPQEIRLSDVPGIRKGLKPVEEKRQARGYILKGAEKHYLQKHPFNMLELILD